MARCQNFLDDTEELCVEVDELALTVAASDLRWAASDAAA